jgi:hypothetical protein
MVFHSFEDLFEAVAGRLPAGGLGGELFRLFDERGLAEHGLLAGGVPGGLGLGGLVLSDGDERIEAQPEAVDIADDVGLVEPATQAARGGEGVCGVGGTRAQPGLQQHYLSQEVLVPAGEVRQSLLGRAGLPRSNGALTGGGFDPDRAVGVHPAVARPVAHL